VKTKYIFIGLLISCCSYAQAQTWDCTPPTTERVVSGKILSQIIRDGRGDYRFRLIEGDNNIICVAIHAQDSQNHFARYQMLRDAWLLGLPVTIDMNNGGARGVTVDNR